jgi:hypothetical protein
LKSLNEILSSFKSLSPSSVTIKEIKKLLNFIEELIQTIFSLKQENQKLKDEVNRLKGEQGKPDISANNQKNDDKDTSEDKDDIDTTTTCTAKNTSSEKERKEVKQGKKGKKFTQDFQADRVIECTIASNDLPDDAKYHSTSESHCQSLIIKVENILVKRFVYYSPSQNKFFTAPLPEGFEENSDYTLDTKINMIILKYECGITEGKMKELFNSKGLKISKGTISNILLKKGEELSQEKEEIQKAAKENGDYIQTDTTSSRVNGINQHSHILVNDFSSVYCTTVNKDRISVIDVLRANTNRVYLLNEFTLDILSYLNTSKKIIERISVLVCTEVMQKEEFMRKLSLVLDEKECAKYQKKLFEAAYLSAYHKEGTIPILVCDDAPQYKLLANFIALCWVHEGRHYKKLTPFIEYHQKILDEFISEFWDFYKKLLSFKKNPSKDYAAKINAQFDELFSKTTGYDELDDRILKTKAKKDSLLVVLKNPSIPLHNNLSEIAARIEVRYRDISFQTRSHRGTIAKDTFFTIIQTAKKNGIDIFKFIYDRLTKSYQMESLASIVERKLIEASQTKLEVD